MIYCHGISNMPPEGLLRSEWDRALFGADQGERTRMAYWVDRERYPEAAGVSTRAIGQDRVTLQPQAKALLDASIQGSDDREASAAFVAAMTKQLEEAALTAAHRGAPMGGRRRSRWKPRGCGAR